MQHSEQSRLAELEADNQRLRRLLDQRDAPAELRHRLRGTLALLRRVIRHSAGTRTEVDAYAAHLEDRLGALMRVQGYIDSNGEVDLFTLIADEFFIYKAHEGGRLRLDGPSVHLQPRSGQALGLAVHEMAVNAVEHGALATPNGEIAIEWCVRGYATDRTLRLGWKETGWAELARPSHQGFGTEIITSLLRYELDAAVEVGHEPDGLRYALSFPLTPNVGREADTTVPT